MSDKPATYVINFDVTDVNLWALARYLHDSRDIIAYWNYLPLVYCVKSYLNATELTHKLRPYFPRTYMVAQINEHNMDGVLPKDAWSWFYMDHHVKQAELPYSLGDLLSRSGIGQLPQLLPRKE